MGSLLLGKKEAIYSLPQNLTVTATGGRNFRSPGNFRGKLPGQSSGPAPERKCENDLAKFSWTGYSGPKTGISGPPEISGENFRGKIPDPLQRESPKGLSQNCSDENMGRNFRCLGCNFWPHGRNFRPREKLQKVPNENGHIFRIRTPFFEVKQWRREGESEQLPLEEEGGYL